MTLINDLYSAYNAMAPVLAVMMIAVFALLAAFFYSIEEDKPVVTYLTSVAVLFTIFMGAMWVVQYNYAKASVEHTLKEAGYTILDGFPTEVGDDFTVKKDGEIQYCITGYDFHGGNTVRIECQN